MEKCYCCIFEPNSVLNARVFLELQGEKQDKRAYDPVASRRREERLFVFDKEEVRLALVEWSCEIVWLRVHDVPRQTERRRQPVHGDLAVVWDIVDLERNLDFQHVCVCGQYFPRSMDLDKISLSILRLLIIMTVSNISTVFVVYRNVYYSIMSVKKKKKISLKSDGFYIYSS